MSSGTTWGKNWVGVSLARGWCCERTSVNRQLTQENRPRSRRRKKREDKNSRVKVPRQSGPPMLQLLAPICSGQNAQWLSNQGTRSLWHTPWLGRGPSKGFLNKQITGVGDMGGALAAPNSALCHDSKKTLQDASLIFSYLKTVSALRHVTYTVLARHAAMTYWGGPSPGTDIDITLCVNNQYGHALTQTLRVSDVLFLGKHWMKNDPGESDPVWSLIGDTGFLLGVHDVILRPLSRSTRNFVEFFIYQTVMKIWGFNNWTFRQKMKVPHQIIYNETLRTTASLHIWILFSEFINLGG